MTRKRHRITLTNNFHNTEITVLSEYNTPGPWAAYQKQGQQGTPLPQWRIHGPGICGAIATVDFDLTQPTCAKQDANVAANAAYIVRACNAHEELLRAAKWLMIHAIATQAMASRNPGNYQGFTQVELDAAEKCLIESETGTSALEFARQAIAKAEEGRA